MNPERMARHLEGHLEASQPSQQHNDDWQESDALASALNHLIEAEQHLRQAHEFLKAARRGSGSGRMKPRE